MIEQGTKLIDLTRLSEFWGLVKTWVQNILPKKVSELENDAEYVSYKPVASREYLDFVSASNTSGNKGARYIFLKLKPTDPNRPCKIRYRMYVSPSATQDAGVDVTYKDYMNLFADITLTIVRGTVIYDTKADFASTAYYPLRYLAMWYLSSVEGLGNGLSHLIGFYTYNGYLPLTLKRDYKIEVIGVEGGTYELLDALTEFSSVDGYNAACHTTTSQIASVIGEYHTGDQNTTYKLNQVAVNNRLPVAAGHTWARYSLALMTKDGSFASVVTTSSAEPTKIVSKVGFLPNMLFYQDTATYASGKETAYNAAYKAIASFDARYTCNATTFQNKPLYLVFNMGDDGLLYLHGIDKSFGWWTQTLPTTRDEHFYMLVGFPYATGSSLSTTNFTLLPENPVYWHDGKKLNILGGVDTAPIYDALNRKQTVIDDLPAIRSGALLGASSVQHEELEAYETAEHAEETYQPKGDYLTEHQSLANKADIDSPEFTGIPLADTADTGTETRQLATTQFVQQEIDRRAEEFHFSVASSSLVIDEVEASTSFINEEGNKRHRLRDEEGNLIQVGTVTDNVVNPSTKRNVTEELELRPEVITISEAKWAILTNGGTDFSHVKAGAIYQLYEEEANTSYDEDSNSIIIDSDDYDEETNTLYISGTYDEASGTLTI